MTTAPLTETELAMLAFERIRWNFAGMREQAIRDQFGISATRYTQRLLALIDRPEALTADPVTVKRLRRVRDQRRTRRAG